MSKIIFFIESIRFLLRNKTDLRSWLEKCAIEEKKKIESLNFIFCSDAYLKKINKQYLNHNYNTDIITFPSSPENDKHISGDIYISIDSIKSNAALYNVSLKDELHRVMVHGLLHLCGYNDHSEKEKKQMRKLEDACLARRSWIK